ncbi:uncharacterized protein [Patagioenas fasciata]|uniref:uncharacterized protein n=1 Tax=Patagioenas fasciata TaxID=372321 RepID=UPI003A9A19C6
MAGKDGGEATSVVAPRLRIKSIRKRYQQSNGVAHSPIYLNSPQKQDENRRPAEHPELPLAELRLQLQVVWNPDTADSPAGHGARVVPVSDLLTGEERESQVEAVPLSPGPNGRGRRWMIDRWHPPPGGSSGRGLAPVGQWGGWRGARRAIPWCSAASGGRSGRDSIRVPARLRVTLRQTNLKARKCRPRALLSGGLAPPPAGDWLRMPSAPGSVPEGSLPRRGLSVTHLSDERFHLWNTNSSLTEKFNDCSCYHCSNSLNV